MLARSSGALDRVRRTIRGVGSLLAGSEEVEEGLGTRGDTLFEKGPRQLIEVLRCEVDAVWLVLNGSSAVTSSICTLS